MPSLAVAIVAKKDKPITHSKPSPKLAIPPDLQSAIELLFFLEERRTGKISPTPAWFFAEAFASQQYQHFQETSALQQFLQTLLGSAYAGPMCISTYYVTVVFALCVKSAMYPVQDEKRIGMEKETGSRFYALCEWCLMQWGVRVGREIYIRVTDVWVLSLSHDNDNNNNTMEEQPLLRKMRRRGTRLGNAIDFLRYHK